jgi:membrane-associated protease RseP (regulator of RpoE activity)
MGSPTSSLPEPDEPEANPYATSLPPHLLARTPFWRREPKVRYLVLFALTLASTTLFGGFSYSVPALAILGAHEFGHYFACVYYGVEASLPYFLPCPIVLTGTLGAVIRIRQPIPSKRALFDIGIAGPIAGFVVTVPVLILGLLWSRVIPIPPPSPDNLEFGEPLLLKFVARLIFGALPPGQTIEMHPMCFAAWFGLLATALNLFPIGQLDGGHITYSVLGRRSTGITLAAVAALAVLAAFVSKFWVAWTVVTVLLLIVFGPRHPRVHDEDVPLDRGRTWLAVAALLIFVLSFSVAPIDLGGLFKLKP